MAKKKLPKKSPKKSPNKSPSAKPSAAKAERKPAKKPAREHHRHEHEHDEHCEDDSCGEEEIVLDETEKKTVDMVLDSEKLRLALETEVSTALTAVVRKFCRQHGTPLNESQAQNVAMVLFGD